MYRPEIDGLRAIAVLAVVFHHYGLAFPHSGHLGVDVFFVLSGFVITQSLAARREASLPGLLRSFYGRRVKRLLPALLVCVVLSSLFALLVAAPGAAHISASLHTGVAALFGVANLHLLAQSTDYFSPAAELNAFTHAWSLGVEEQFYLLFPLLLWFGWLRRFPLGSRRLAGWMAFLGGASLLAWLWSLGRDPNLAFYSMPTRFWELAAGVLAYLGVARVQGLCGRRGRLADGLTLAALALLLLVLAGADARTYPELATLAVVGLTAALLPALRPGQLAHRLLTLGPLVFVGLISYSLYLWHWSLLTLGRWTLGLEGWAIPLLLGLSFALAAASYAWVERPLRHARWPRLRLGSHRRAGPLAYAGLSAAGWTGLVVLVLLPLHGQGHFYTGNAAPLLKKGVASLEAPHEFQGRVLWEGRHCVLASNDEVGKQIRPEDCTLGDFAAAPRRFLVLGNSFSAAQIALFAVLAERGLGAVTLTAAWNAPPAPGMDKRGPWGEANAYYWEVVVPSLLERLREGDLVFVVSGGAEFSPRRPDGASQARLQVLGERLSAFAEDLAGRGLGLAYQDGLPFLLESGCTPDTAMPQWWHFGGEPPCRYYSREATLQRRAPYSELLRRLQREHPNFFVLDLFDAFCPESRCRFYDRNGVFLYRDEGAHPSIEGAVLARPLLLEAVAGMVTGTDISFAKERE
jgi:peptidoglycan/LPS O-acetylase OafA/YrhL